MRYIGIDLGGTTIKGGIFTRDGNCLKSMEIPTGVERGFEAIVGDLGALVFRLAESVDEKHRTGKDALEEVQSVGIGIPGLSEGSTGHVLFCTNLAWTDLPLGTRLKEITGLPVFVDNDATVAGYAESVFGVTKGYKNSIFLTLGTGIGGGMIVNGHIYSGSHYLGSEIGHMMIGDNFYKCTCGRNGCFETFASATAMVKYAEHLFEVQTEGGPASAIYEAYQMGQLSAKKIFDAAKAEDPIALKVVDRTCHYLARGILNLYDILDPDIIALGGGVSKAGEYLLEKVQGLLRSQYLVKAGTYGKVVLAELGNDAGIVGAAMLGLNYID